MKFQFFPNTFKKNAQISDLMKIHPVGAELFHEDGQIERQTHEEANSHFLQFLTYT
jgi:hypothetical protein